MNNYQRAREMAGFTQKELAEKIGMKPGIISRYEAESNLTVVPPLSRIKAIAEACGVPMSFLTDERKQNPLDDEQADRFKKELRVRADVYSKHPDETAAVYGTEHPFLYMLKERWIPTEYDVHYVCKRHGMDELLILNKDLPSESEINARIRETMFRDEYGNIIIKSSAESFQAIRKYLFNRGYLITDKDAKLFEECGVKVINENDGSHLYMNIDLIDPEAIRAIIVLTRQAQRFQTEELSDQKENPPQNPEDPRTD